MVAMLAGAGVGFGVFLGWRAFHPSPPPLARVLAGFGRPGVSVADLEEGRSGYRYEWANRLGQATLRFLDGIGLADSGELGRRLRVLEKPAERHAFEKLLAGVGEALGVDELRELAASAHLAGDQGARIRASLAAKADSMRAHQTAAIEAQAEAATEKMLLPVVALVVGMILFIGFGVVQAISTPATATLP